jgi:cytochrome c556
VTLYARTIIQIQETCMKRTLALGSLFTAIIFSLPAHAQFAKPEDAIKYRKASLTLLSTHFGRLGAMAQGKAPFDAKLAADNADVIAAVGKLPWGAFVEGSDKGETRAKPEIWKESARFKEAQDKNQAELAKLVAAAKTGNLDNLKAAFSAAAPTCKGCHDHFRKD